jgi:hypothetical protein
MTTTLALGLSVRTQTCLDRANVMSVSQILDMTEEELLSIRNFGEKSLEEVRDKICLWSQRIVALDNLIYELFEAQSIFEPGDGEFYANVAIDRYLRLHSQYTPFAHRAPRIHPDYPDLY